jgi:hypothetical protein
LKHRACRNRDVNAGSGVPIEAHFCNGKEPECSGNVTAMGMGLAAGGISNFEMPR